MELKERCQKMIEELGIPITKFCRNVNMSTMSYYNWQRDKINLTEERLKNIDAYISRYGF